MKYKKTLILFVSLLMVFSLSSFAKTKKLTRVNVYPFAKGGVANVDALKSLVDTRAEDIKTGFEKAGAAFLYPAFIDQVKSVSIEEIVIPKGQKMEWMLFKAGKKIKAVKDIQWEGKKTLEVFKFYIQNDCKDYQIIVPKACANITLVDVKNSMAVCNMTVKPEKANIGDPITIDMSGSKCATRYEIEVYHPKGKLIATKKLTAGNTEWKTEFKEPGDYFIDSEAFNADGIASKDKCHGKVYINYPPECDLKVEPTSGYTGKPFKLDASGSTDKDGKVVKADFTIAKDGKEVETKSVTTDPLIWEKAFKKSGIYNISLKVTDDFGAVCKKTCSTDLEVQKRLYLVLEGGPGVAKGTYSGILFARIGVAYLLVPEKWSLIATAGGAAALAGDPFKTHFMGNVLINAHFNKAFVGAGIGFTSKVREPDWDGGVDFVGNIGFDVFESFNKKGSIFGEIRVPLSKDPGFDHAHEILVGFRMLL